MVGRSRTHHMNAVASIRAGCRVRTLSATLKRDYQLVRPTCPVPRGPGVGPHAQAREAARPAARRPTYMHMYYEYMHMYMHM